MTAAEMAVMVWAITNTGGIILIVLMRRELSEIQKNIKTTKSRVSSIYLMFLINERDGCIQREQYEEARKIENIIKQIKEE